MASKGLLIAGLSSASGKTLTSLGLMRACRLQGRSVAAAKTGPDYIDPGFHAAALGSASVNLDPFAMGDDLLKGLATSQPGEVLIIEGVMGVFDGGTASTASLAQRLGVPVVLVMDIRGQAETAAAIAGGIRSALADRGANLAGVILNRCRSPRHQAIAGNAIRDAGISVLGAMAETPGMTVPSRHLGLVQAVDLDNLDAVLDQAAGAVSDGVDIDALLDCAAPLPAIKAFTDALPPPAQRIAVAKDAAFGFGYAHLLSGWRRQGAEILPFSPLADQAPDAKAEFVFLPGGYPELHLDTLTAAHQFRDGLARMAARGVAIYGECGGYMVLGEAITGKNGERRPMTGLLELETSFAEPALHLGYRQLERVGPAPLPARLRGHEFHYTRAIRQHGEPLFNAADRDSLSLGPAGLVKGSVAGSYMHLIAAV